MGIVSYWLSLWNCFKYTLSAGISCINYVYVAFCCSLYTVNKFHFSCNMPTLNLFCLVVNNTLGNIYYGVVYALSYLA